MSNVKYQMSKNNSKSIGNYKSNSGFTLIELLVAFSVIITISIISVTSYSQFANFQRFNNTVLDVATILQKAKSRTQSQVKPDTIAACVGNPLAGYEVHMCTFSGAACATAGEYQLRIRCGNTTTLVETKKLPTNVTFAAGTRGVFSFRVLTGAVQAGNIIITGFGKSKTIQVSATGNIYVP
jgi:type II secretory pathway pseudopilin PulG